MLPRKPVQHPTQAAPSQKQRDDGGRADTVTSAVVVRNSEVRATCAGVMDAPSSSIHQYP